MPAGTVKVDVSDVYDWYKLGQHISNLKGLGKHDFGSGPPSTIMAFGDEDTEHKYIGDLEKTGLTTTDIDPVDPHQPKGMKRQKVDPTYNVGEGVAEDSNSTLSYQGNCTQDDVIEYIFGDVNNFARMVEEHGDEFTVGDLVVKYDPEEDIHSFYYKKQGVKEDTSNIPQYLYHATYRPLLKSIKTNGLGGSGAQAKWEDSKPGVTYLALDADVAESYAESSDIVPDEWLDKIIILKISTRGLDTSKFNLDSNVLDNEGDTLEYHGIIPISNISVVKRDIDEAKKRKRKKNHSPRSITTGWWGTYFGDSGDGGDGGGGE
jgi:hypothetical protein